MGQHQLATPPLQLVPGNPHRALVVGHNRWMADFLPHARRRNLHRVRPQSRRTKGTVGVAGTLDGAIHRHVQEARVAAGVGVGIPLFPPHRDDFARPRRHQRRLMIDGLQSGRGVRDVDVDFGGRRADRAIKANETMHQRALGIAEAVVDPNEMLFAGGRVGDSGLDRSHGAGVIRQIDGPGECAPDEGTGEDVWRQSRRQTVAGVAHRAGEIEVVPAIILPGDGDLLARTDRHLRCKGAHAAMALGVGGEVGDQLAAGDEHRRDGGGAADVGATQGIRPQPHRRARRGRGNRDGCLPHIRRRRLGGREAGRHAVTDADAQAIDQVDRLIDSDDDTQRAGTNQGALDRTEKRRHRVNRTLDVNAAARRAVADKLSLQQVRIGDLQIERHDVRRLETQAVHTRQQPDIRAAGEVRTRTPPLNQAVGGRHRQTVAERELIADPAGTGGLRDHQLRHTDVAVEVLAARDPGLKLPGKGNGRENSAAVGHRHDHRRCGSLFIPAQEKWADFRALRRAVEHRDGEVAAPRQKTGERDGPRQAGGGSQFSERIGVGFVHLDAAAGDLAPPQRNGVSSNGATNFGDEHGTGRARPRQPVGTKTLHRRQGQTSNAGHVDGDSRADVARWVNRANQQGTHLKDGDRHLPRPVHSARLTDTDIVDDDGAVAVPGSRQAEGPTGRALLDKHRARPRVARRTRRKRNHRRRRRHRIEHRRKGTNAHTFQAGVVNGVQVVFVVALDERHDGGEALGVAQRQLVEARRRLVGRERDADRAAVIAKARQGHLGLIGQGRRAGHRRPGQLPHVDDDHEGLTGIGAGVDRTQGQRRLTKGKGPVKCPRRQTRSGRHHFDAVNGESTVGLAPTTQGQGRLGGRSVNDDGVGKGFDRWRRRRGRIERAKQRQFRRRRRIRGLINTGRGNSDLAQRHVDREGK